MNEFNRLLHMYAASAFDRQLRLADWVGDADWELDLDNGHLRYEGEGSPSFRIQVLGLEAPGTGWLWAWDAPVRRWPDSFLTAADRLRDLGVETGARYLTAPRLQEGEVDGRLLALVASGACQASGFFRCEVPSGIIYCLLAEPSLPQTGWLPAWRVVEVFPQVLEQLALDDPPLAFTWYLRALGLRPDLRGTEIRATGQAGDRVVAHFGPAGELANLRAEMTT